MDKRGSEKPHPWPFDLLCCLFRVYSKYSNRAVTLIQQSCISNTLVEQSSHIAYAITKMLNKLINITLKGSRDLKERYKVVKQVSGS